MITVRPASPRDLDALQLLDDLSRTLAGITGDSGRSSFDPADTEQDGAMFVLAFDCAGPAVGCGAFRPLEPKLAEVKRMFARPGTRGVGAAVLLFLEGKAQAMGYKEFWLETRRVNTRAVEFYRKHAYHEIANFGKYAGRPEAICLAKRLVA